MAARGCVTSAPRPLIEDGSIESARRRSSTLEARLPPRGRFDVRVDLLNALDSDDDDITYFYASRLPGEPDEGVEDDTSIPSSRAAPVCT